MNAYFALNFIIYKITSPANRIYIGCTNDFERRVKQHLNNIQSVDNKLYSHLRQHKPELIKFEILYSNLSAKQAFALERGLIKKFNTRFKGLNHGAGGEGVSIYTDLESQHRQSIQDEKTEGSTY